MPHVRNARTKLSFADMLAIGIIAISPIAYIISSLLAAPLSILGILAIAYSMGKPRGFFRDKGVIAAALLLGFLGLSTTWSENPPEALKAWLVMLVYQVSLFLLAMDRTPRLTAKIIVASTILTTITMLLGAAYFFYNFGTIRPEGIRSLGLVQYSTFVSAQVTLSLPFLVYIYKTREDLRAIAVASILVGLTLAYLSFTRSALVMVPAVLFASFVFISRRPAVSLLKFSPVILILAATGALLAGPASFESEGLDRLEQTDISDLFSDDLAKRTNYNYSKLYDRERRVMSAVGISLVKDASLLGAGYYSIGYLVKDRIGVFVQSHNIVFTIIGEAGIIGGALGAIYMFFIFRASARLFFSYREDIDIQLLSRALILTVGVGLVIAQYKTMSALPIFFCSIGAIFSLSRALLASDVQKSSGKKARSRKLSRHHPPRGAIPLRTFREL